MEVKDDFYTALRDSQPLAFLASLSIAIAVLSGNKIAEIHNHAIIAGSMFIFSFIISMFSKTVVMSEGELKQYVNWTRNFFLIIGIGYLTLTVLDFSKDLPQIIRFIFAWMFLAGALSFILPMKDIVKKSKKEHGGKLASEEKPRFIVVSIMASVFLVASGLFFFLALA